MVNILTKARAHATSPAAAKSNGYRVKAASLLYEQIKPLSGQIVIYKGSEARLSVSRQLEEVTITFFAREQRQTNPGHYGNGVPIPPEMTMKDTDRMVAQASACGMGEDGFQFTDLAGLQKSFGASSDLVDHVAAYFGPMLKSEE